MRLNRKIAVSDVWNKDPLPSFAHVPPVPPAPRNGPFLFLRALLGRACGVLVRLIQQQQRSQGIKKTPQLMRGGCCGGCYRGKRVKLVLIQCKYLKILFQRALNLYTCRYMVFCIYPILNNE
jgi:hypothetical protein